MKKISLFHIWILYLLLFVAGAGFIWTKGFKIDTDFLSIFPSHQNSPGFREANALYEKNFANEILVFVKAATYDEAIINAEAFVKKAEDSKLFDKIHAKAADNSWVSYLYSHRDRLLTTEQIQDINENKGQKLVQKALQNLYSPMGMTSQFKTDPLNLFQDALLKTSASFSLRPFKGYLITEDSAVFVRLELGRQSYKVNEDLVAFYESSKKENQNVYFLGAPLFSAVGSEKSMSEVNVYGGLSFVGLLILLVWCFSSLIPVFASLGTIAISVGTGLVAVMLFYQSVHILSILLGISVLGIVTDYCTHFFAKGFDPKLNNGSDIIKKIRGALLMGFLTNVFTYICFYFTDLLVLKQLAVFTIVGIFTTYITVLAVFPLFPFRRLQVGNLKKFIQITLPWKKMSPYKSMALMLGFVLMGLFSMGGLHFNDDVRLLQGVDENLKKDEAQVLSYLSASRSSSYLILQADSAEELLQKEETLGSQLSISHFVPSLKKQNESLMAYEKLDDPLKIFYKSINTPYKNSEFKSSDPITVSDFVGRSSDLPIPRNWIGEIKGKHYSVVNVTSDFKKYETDTIQFFNKAEDISDFIGTLRSTIMGQFGYVLILLSAILFFSWGWKKALFILFPPVISALSTLFLIRLTGQPLNLFHVMAVILIFCLGMDYSVFFSQSKDSIEATRVGILISFISTVGSFGVLSLSSTYAVSSFGLTVFIGITLCYLISPLAEWSERA